MEVEQISQRQRGSQKQFDEPDREKTKKARCKYFLLNSTIFQNQNKDGD